jgi:pilus assembly protein Flp/PilA
MSRLVTRFLKDESGATAIEYGLIVALVVMVLVTAITAIGSKLLSTFQQVSDSVPAT